MDQKPCDLTVGRGTSSGFLKRDLQRSTNGCIVQNVRPQEQTLISQQSTFSQRVIVVIVSVVLCQESVADEQFAQPWQRQYQGADANGPHVIGYWSFDPDDTVRGSGPNRLPGKLDGAIPVVNGKFGGGLESFPGWPAEDKHHAMVVENQPRLSPGGAFTSEMWMCSVNGLTPNRARCEPPVSATKSLRWQVFPVNNST